MLKYLSKIKSVHSTIIGYHDKSKIAKYPNSIEITKGIARLYLNMRIEFVTLNKTKKIKIEISSILSNKGIRIFTSAPPICSGIFLLNNFCTISGKQKINKNKNMIRTGSIKFFCVNMAGTERIEIKITNLLETSRFL